MHMTFDMNVTYGHNVSFICYIQLHIYLRMLLLQFVFQFSLLGMNISFCAYYLRVTSDNVYCEICRSFFEKCFRFQLLRLFNCCSVSNSLIKCKLKLDFVHFISLWFCHSKCQVHQFDVLLSLLRFWFTPAWSLSTVCFSQGIAN